MSGPEDFKLGHKYNAGDPEGRRVMADKPMTAVSDTLLPPLPEPDGTAEVDCGIDEATGGRVIGMVDAWSEKLVREAVRAALEKVAPVASPDVDAFVHSALWPADTSEARIATIAIEAYLKAHNAWQARAPKE